MIDRNGGGKALADQEGEAAWLSAFELIDAPGHLLRRNHQRSYEIFSQIVGSDVTRQQIALLITLAKNPGASQNLVVGATGFDKSTLKEMLGRMIERGWVERTRDPADSRCWNMYVTEAGERLLQERIEKVAAVQDAILAPLPPNLRPVFVRCLRILLGLETAEPD